MSKNSIQNMMIIEILIKKLNILTKNLTYYQFRKFVQNKIQIKLGWNMMLLVYILPLRGMKNPFFLTKNWICF